MCSAGITGGCPESEWGGRATGQWGYGASGLAGRPGGPVSDALSAQVLLAFLLGSNLGIFEKIWDWFCLRDSGLSL